MKGLISTLISKVDEDFIDKIKIAATTLFFQRRNQASFNLEDIKETILSDYHSLIYALPSGANRVERGMAIVSRPRFKEQIGQRVYWVSRIAFHLSAYDDQPSTVLGASIVTPSVQFFGSTGFTAGYSGFAGYSSIGDNPSAGGQLETLPQATATQPPVYKISRIPSKTGIVAFDVTWSVVVTREQNLTDPKVESIEHAETIWE